jgi:hypothetical protein
MIDYFKAVHSLVGGNMGGPSDGPVSDYTFDDGQTPPTEKAIQAKLKELQADYDAKQYQRDREREYPDLQECIHAILDDDLTALQAKRKLVKAKYPKPK